VEFGPTHILQPLDCSDQSSAGTVRETIYRRRPGHPGRRTHHLQQSAGQRDICPVSVNLPSAFKNISVPGLVPDVAWWCNGRASDLRSRGREFDSRPGRCCATTLGKLFTSSCLDGDTFRWYTESLNWVLLAFLPRSLTLIPVRLFPTSSGSWSDFITWTD